MKRSLLTLILTLTVVVSACAPRVDESPASPDGATAPVVEVELTAAPMSAEDSAAIDARIAAVMEAHPDVPAFYIGVWDPERGMYQQAYGLADVANERPASVADHFRIGSISKTFMATVMLQLVDEGLLSLDDTVAEVDAPTWQPGIRP